VCSSDLSPDALEMADAPKKKNSNENPFDFTEEDLGLIRETVNEIKSASENLQSIKWKLGYLVNKDGKTPCLTHRFLVRNDYVTLNLNHDDVKQMVALSRIEPSLASHWMTAMCLIEGNQILKHLSQESKEDLLTIDAMAKLNMGLEKNQISSTNPRLVDVLKKHYNNRGDFQIGMN
jgi:hypothetical protein